MGQMKQKNQTIKLLVKFKKQKTLSFVKTIVFKDQRQENKGQDETKWWFLGQITDLWVELILVLSGIFKNSH